MSHIYIAIIVTSAAFILVAHVKPLKSSFYLGPGHYGPWVSGISVVATFTGGGALINTTMLASKYGEWAFFDVFPAVIGLLASALLVSIGFFGKRFSENFFDIKNDLYNRQAVATHYAQVAFLYVLVMAAQLRAVATVADQLQIPTLVAVLFCTATVAVYAFRGFAAVTRTDMLQLAFMVPLYIILAYVAFEPNGLPLNEATTTQVDMPLSLIIALCLPLFFLPISQEIHQRGAAVATNKNITYSYLLAAAIYALLGSLLVIAFSSAPHLSFARIISGENGFAAVAVTVGLLSAILSTLDTSTNIASHAFQKLSPFSRLWPAVAQVFLLIISALLFLYFKTVLSIILFALFLYMAGPALTFVGVFAGIHPRACALAGGIFSSLQAFFHFKGGKLLEYEAISAVLPLADPIRMGILLLLAQAAVLVTLGIRRRFT